MIRFVSDLHLEFSNIEINDSYFKDCSVLILAGDIVNEAFDLEFLLDKLPPMLDVVFVAGNHEYNFIDIQSQRENFKKLEKKYPNFIFLDNKSWVKDGIAFIGSTLWTDFNYDGNQEENMSWAADNISDFMITGIKEKDKIRRLNPHDVLMMHNEAKDFIGNEIKIQRSLGNRVVVVTHFAPSVKSIDKKWENSNSSYWVSNLDDIAKGADVWVHGHTHTSFNYLIGNCNVLCNPRGYSKYFNLNENQEFGFEFFLDKNLTLKKEQ